MAKSNDKTHQKRLDNNYHIHHLVQAFSNVENGGLNLFYSAKPLTCTTGASNLIILIMMCEQNKQTQ